MESRGSNRGSVERSSSIVSQEEAWLGTASKARQPSTQDLVRSAEVTPEGRNVNNRKLSPVAIVSASFNRSNSSSKENDATSPGLASAVQTLQQKLKEKDDTIKELTEKVNGYSALGNLLGPQWSQSLPS